MGVTIWTGLTLGSVYVLVSLGLTLSMLPSRVFNFAHGALVLVGMYLTYQFLPHLGLIPTVALNLVIGLALGVISELVTVRALRMRGGETQHGELITTVGMSTILVGVSAIAWGYLPLSVPFDGPTTPVRFLGVIATPNEILSVALAIMLAFACHTWFHRTRWGQACLAVAEDREASSLRGINVDFLSLAGFAVAAALGTVTAIVMGPITYALPELAHTLVLGGFVAIALGGDGNFLGNLYGGLLVGLTSAVAARYIGPSWSEIAVFVLLLVTLTLRPSGLGTGVKETRVV